MGRVAVVGSRCPVCRPSRPNRAVTVTAQAALDGADGIGALVHVVDPTDSLRQTPNDLWAATPVDRIEALLRENDVEIGIVTDGRWWGLVCARDGAHGRLRHRRCPDVGRGAPHPRCLPHRDRPPARHRRRPSRAAPVLVRGIGRGRRGDHRGPRRAGSPRSRAADPVLLRVRCRRHAGAACPTRSRPARTTLTKPPSR